MALAVPIGLWSAPMLWLHGLTSWLVIGIAYAALTLFWTPDPLTGIYALSHIALFAGSAILGAHESIVRGMVIGVALSTPLVLAQAFGYSPGVEQAVSPAGLFLNRNVLVEIAAPLMVYAWLSGMRVWAFLLGVIVILAHDRAMAVGLAAVIFLHAPPRRRVMVLVAAVAILAGLTWLSPWGVASLANRMNITAAALDGLTPWGRGIGSFGALYPAWEHAHCDPLQLILDLGFGAFPFFVVMWNAVGCDDRERLAERAALVCLVVESAFSMPLQLPVGTLLAGVLVGSLYRSRTGLRDCGHDGRDHAGAHA